MADRRKAKIRQLTSDYMDKQSIAEEHKRRRRKGLVRRLSFVSFFMLIFAIFAGVTLYQQQSTIESQKIENYHLEEELSYMESEEERLTQEIEWLHDPEYIAELARRDYFLTKPGETLFQLPRSASFND